MKKLLVCFAFLALAIASAKSYSVSLTQPVKLGSTELQPGDYKVEVVGEKAVLRLGKQSAEAPVKVETADREFRATSLRLQSDGATPRIAEIRIGGTKTKLVFD